MRLLVGCTALRGGFISSDFYFFGTPEGWEIERPLPGVAWGSREWEERVQPPRAVPTHPPGFFSRRKQELCFPAGSARHCWLDPQHIQLPSIVILGRFPPSCQFCPCCKKSHSRPWRSCSKPSVRQNLTGALLTFWECDLNGHAHTHTHERWVTYGLVDEFHVSFQVIPALYKATGASDLAWHSVRDAEQQPLW